MGGGSAYHDPPPPSTLTGVTPRMICPGCSLRFARVVDPNCVLCSGLGTLTLGHPAIHHHGPWTTALAVQLYIEANARQADTLFGYAQRPEALERTISDLQAAGALARPTDGPYKPPTKIKRPHRKTTRPLAQRVSEAWGTTPTPADHAAITAPTSDVSAARRGRPHLIPIVSQTGHPSHTARIADAIVLDGPNVTAIAVQQQTAHRAAARLQPALTEAAGGTK